MTVLWLKLTQKQHPRCDRSSERKSTGSFKYLPFCKTPLTYRWLIWFRSMLSRAFRVDYSIFLPTFSLALSSSSPSPLLGNLRTTIKSTTTTSVDCEKTGTRTSVSAGKRKLKMQSVGRSTTTTLNVNTNVKLCCSFATKFFAMASFKTMQDLIF